MPQSNSLLPALQGRLLLQFQKLALSWDAVRNKRGRTVALRQDHGLVAVHDGMREIHIPDVRQVGHFRTGINVRLDTVATKYFGSTEYLPRPGDVIVDIGAGIGEFTLWCADAGAKVVAFEPDPLAFACLEKNTQSLADIEVYPYALWKERAHLRLHSSHDTAESSLIEDGKANWRLSEVEAWPLDQFKAVVARPVIDLMKVDGEGVEPEILTGAARALRRTRVIAVDVSATDRRPNLVSRIETQLQAMNFRPVPNERSDTILALNTAMVGPFNSLGRARRGT